MKNGNSGAMNGIFQKKDYVLFFLLIQISWIGEFTNIPKMEIVLFIIIFFISFLKYKKILFDNKIFILFVIYSLLAMIQGFIWSFSLVSLITSFLVGFLLPYYFFQVYKADFLDILEKTIRFLTIVSLILWILHQLFPIVKELLQTIIGFINRGTVSELYLVRGMLFYTYWPGLDQDFGLSRNAGFAYEPATFAGFILLGMLINYSKNIDLFHKKNIIYIIALISSFSTGGYLSLAVLGLLLIKQKRGRLLGIFLFPVFIAVFVFSFTNLNFMQNKINEQYDDQTNTSINTPTSGRILGARKSLVVLKNHPFYGRGLLAMTKPEEMSDPEYAQYGWLSQVARFGLIFGSFYMFFIFRGIYLLMKSGGHDSFSFLVFSTALLINMSAQALIASPFYTIFFFYGLYNYKNFKQRNFSDSHLART